MRDEKPRLGPWLRRYAQPDEKHSREGLPEVVVAGAAAVGILGLLVVLLMAFVRFPFPTLGVLVLVWGIGYVLFLNHKRRAELREQLRKAGMEREEQSR